MIECRCRQAAEIIDAAKSATALGWSIKPREGDALSPQSFRERAIVGRRGWFDHLPLPE